MCDLRLLLLAAGVLFVCMIDVQPAGAETGPDAIPNFSSVDSPWYPIGGIRPPAKGLGAVGTVRSDIIQRELDNAGNVTERSLALMDVQNPNLKPWAAEVLKKTNEERIAGKRSYGSHATCMPAGLPDFLTIGGAFQALYLMQSPKEVLMVNSFDSQARRIYMNVPHAANLQPSWYGDSIGHYEGDTLVVDTIGLNDKTLFSDNVPHTAQLHVVERLKLIQNGTQLQVEFTIEDPGTFNAPWGGIVTYRHRGNGFQLTEAPCAESNALNGGSFFPQETGAEVIPIPVAGKPDF